MRIDELPEVLREEFRACRDALTRERPLRGEDAVRATVRKMSSCEADELACSVVRLFAAIVRECAIDAANEAALAASGATLNGATLNGTAHDGSPLNGLAAGVRVRNGVPQVIALEFTGKSRLRRFCGYRLRFRPRKARLSRPAPQATRM
ncbi:MAG: hypothetical protein ACLPTM_04465 [Steroidobacteraceae bacterium]